MPNINEFDRAEIARLVKEGYTSGILDPEGRRRIWWDLSLEGGEDEILVLKDAIKNF